MVLQSLAGLPAFLAYFCVSLVALVIYRLIYALVTRHDEYELIRRNDAGRRRCARTEHAGLFAAGRECGRACGRYRRLHHLEHHRAARSDHRVLRRAYCGARLSERIEKGEMAAAIWLGLASVTAGVLSAASMTW